MILELRRHTYNVEIDRNIIGDLYIDGKFFCHTLEDEKRADGVKVKHETAIPCGTYKVKLTMSNRFKRVLPLLMDVKGFSGIRMHGGNTSKDTSGCPLVAFKTDYLRIWNSAEKKLIQRLQSADEDITIEIKDCFLSYNPKTHRNKV